MLNFFENTRIFASRKNGKSIKIKSVKYIMIFEKREWYAEINKNYEK